MIVVLLVFTFAQTKLSWYILPAFPAFSIAISSLLYQLSMRILKLKRKHQRSVSL
jgi:4-amino-4-deoxy-L-arabinose transferase-like glycosyltransferase